MIGFVVGIDSSYQLLQELTLELGCSCRWLHRNCRVVLLEQHSMKSRCCTRLEQVRKFLELGQMIRILIDHIEEQQQLAHR